MKGDIFRKLPAIALCVLLVLGVFAANHILLQAPIDNEPLKEPELANTEGDDDALNFRGTRSSPGWMEEIRLTNASGDSTTPQIAVSGNNVHVVWSDDRDGNYEIFYNRSVDGGLSWENETQLTFTSYSQVSPKIAVNGDIIHVVWDNYTIGDICYINSTDNGETWGSITIWNWTSYPPCSMNDPLLFPDIAVSGSNVYIVGYCFSNDDIIFKRSSDNGDSWTSWILVDVSTWLGTIPFIETDGSLIHVVYFLNAGSFDALVHFYSDDQGDNWIDDTWNPFVTADSDDSELMIDFAISMEGSNLRVVYSIEDWGEPPPNDGGVYTKYWNRFDGSWYGPYKISDLL